VWKLWDGKREERKKIKENNTIITKTQDLEVKDTLYDLQNHLSF
jgi:hypothetical protein